MCGGGSVKKWLGPVADVATAVIAPEALPYVMGGQSAYDATQGNWTGAALNAAGAAYGAGAFDPATTAAPSSVGSGGYSLASDAGSGGYSLAPGSVGTAGDTGFVAGSGGAGAGGLSAGAAGATGALANAGGGAPAVAEGGWNPALVAQNTGSTATDVSAGTTGAITPSSVAPTAGAAPGATAGGVGAPGASASTSVLPGGGSGAGVNTAAGTGLPTDANAFQPSYDPSLGPVASQGTAGAAGGAGAASTGGAAGSQPSMLDQAVSKAGSLGTKALDYLGKGNNALQVGTLALGAYSVMSAAQKQQAAQSMGQQIQNLGIPLTSTSNSLLQQYANGTLNPADQFAIQQYVQSNIAAAKDYYSKAGLGDSSMMQSAIQTIQQQGEAMRSAALSSYLTNATQLATAGNAQQTTGIQSQIAADQGLQSSQQALLQALATMTAGQNKQTPATASTAPATAPATGPG